MSRFPVEWLRLREPFDHAARADDLVDALCASLTEQRPLRVVELGAGRGSGMRYLAPRLPGPQHWTLIDHDPDLLQDVGPLPSAVAQCLPMVADLRDPRSLTVEADLLSTQALLDLVSEEWLIGLTEWLAARRVPFVAALTVDGRVSWLPEAPLDAEVQAAFRAHQLTDRGFGTSPGPRAAEAVSYTHLTLPTICSV